MNSNRVKHKFGSTRRRIRLRFIGSNDPVAPKPCRAHCKCHVLAFVIKTAHSHTHTERVAALAWARLMDTIEHGQRLIGISLFLINENERQSRTQTK